MIPSWNTRGWGVFRDSLDRMFWIPWMAATRWRRWLFRGFTLKLRDSKPAKLTMGGQWVVGDFGNCVSDSSGAPKFLQTTDSGANKTNQKQLTHQNPSKSARHSCVVGGWCQVFRAVFETWEFFEKNQNCDVKDTSSRTDTWMAWMAWMGWGWSSTSTARWFDTIIHVDALFPLSLNAEVARKNLGHREFLPVSASMRELAAANEPVCKSLAHLLESFRA